MPRVPALVSQTPVISTQLQPIMAPKPRAMTSRDFSTFANVAGSPDNSAMYLPIPNNQQRILRVEKHQLLRKFTATAKIALLC